MAPGIPDVLPVPVCAPDAAPDVLRPASIVVEAPCTEFDAALLEEGVFVVGWGMNPAAVTFPFAIIGGRLREEDTQLSADCCTFFSAAQYRGDV